MASAATKKSMHRAPTVLNERDSSHPAEHLSTDRTDQDSLPRSITGTREKPFGAAIIQSGICGASVVPTRRPPCLLLPSRPEEFHPEPLTDPDLNLSIHPARATERRLPSSVELRAPPGYPVDPFQRR